jgi:hypothetical protein
MSRQDVAAALEAMQDDSKREQLAAGDYSGLDLTDDEQSLVRRAAASYPEVVPFFTLIELQLNTDIASSVSGGPAAGQPADLLLPAVQSVGDDWHAAYTYAIGGGPSA